MIIEPLEPEFTKNSSRTIIISESAALIITPRLQYPTMYIHNKGKAPHTVQ